ncbi:5'-hydroxyaverantin dehydrogenase [Cladophialophora carrionii]|uniref:5'-hydroxyaverantin dehydrogenase n=1 Tax=Cladophialophora carrionii TaxID=86049 RepID=A0A1C1CBQ9_9EURO|nr:5'-hydroxyaverantin dehydrogenase [Cladophialophora carrionii]
MPATPVAGMPGFTPYSSDVVHSGPVDVGQAINLDNIRGKTIVITGGASGFGAACSRHWASHGANIILGDLNHQQGTELVSQLRQTTENAQHHFIPLDVTSWTSQVHFFREAARLSPHGGIDTVMANAGIADAEEQRLFEQQVPDYSRLDGPAPPPPPPKLRTYETNLTGVLYTAHLALSYLSRNPGSQKCKCTTTTGHQAEAAAAAAAAPRDRHLLLVASVAGLAGLPGQPLYTAAKHGVVGLFRSLRITSPITLGVRVNMINPYFVDTPILGPLGAFVLAGGAMARLEAVVEASTRLVADHGIIGRGLIIASKTSKEHAEAVGLEPQTEHYDDRNQEIWDCYADDFEQSDLFTRRIVAVTNLVTSARGLIGIWVDIGSNLSRRFWRALGY